MSKIPPVIWLKQGTRKNKVKYYLYDIFTSRKEAIWIAQLHKKKDKSKYFIMETEEGFWFPYKTYALYLNNIKTKASLTA